MLVLLRTNRSCHVLKNPLILHCSSVCVNALNFYLLCERVWWGDVRKTSGEISYWARVLAEKSREPEFKSLVPTLKNKQTNKKQQCGGGKYL